MRKLPLMLLWSILSRWMATSSVSCPCRSLPSHRSSPQMHLTVSTSNLCHPERRHSHHSRRPLTPTWTSAAPRTTSAQSMPSALIHPSCTSARAPPTTLTSPIRWISTVCTRRRRLRPSSRQFSTFVGSINWLTQPWLCLFLDIRFVEFKTVIEFNIELNSKKAASVNPISNNTKLVNNTGMCLLNINSWDRVSEQAHIKFMLSFVCHSNPSFFISQLLITCVSRDCRNCHLVRRPTLIHCFVWEWAFFIEPFLRSGSYQLAGQACVASNDHCVRTNWRFSRQGYIVVRRKMPAIEELTVCFKLTLDTRKMTGILTTYRQADSVLSMRADDRGNLAIKVSLFLWVYTF